MADGVLARSGAGPRRGVVAALLGTLLLLVAGCVDLPREGAVAEGPARLVSDPVPRFLADGPREGASPESVVEGYLRASAAFDDDYSTARLFLTESSAQSWRPTERVVVVADRGLVVGAGGSPLPPPGEGGPMPTATQGTVRTVRVTAPLVGEVDDRGRWTTAPPRSSYAVDLEVVRVDGAWRVSDPPDEVVLGQDVFTQIYRPYPLHFLNPSRSALVPEMRWFPGRSPSATLLVSELLAGPSPWLADAVRTAFPEGASLLSSPPAVPLDASGTAVVDLSEQVREAEPRQRALMRAQLRATLESVPGVRDVRLSAEGGALAPEPAQADPSLRDPSALPAAPVVLSGGRIARLDGNGAQVVPGLRDVSTMLPSDPAVGAGGLVAVLAQQRSQLLVGLPEESDDTDVPGLRVVLTGESLVPPSVGPRGWVWTTPAAAGGRLRAVDASGTVVAVSAPWLQGRRVVALQVSRDGARIVVASVDERGAAHLDVAGVVRDEDGAPERLEVPEHPPLPALVDVHDVGWADDTTVVALGAVEEGRSQLLWVAVDGSFTRSADVPQGVQDLTSAEGASRVLLGAPGGGVLVPAGQAWVVRPGSETSTDPSYPG